MSEYDNKGTASLWKNDKYEAGGKAPRLKGQVYAHRDIKAGEKISIALWDGSSDNPKAPVLKGKVEDVYKADAGQAAPTPSAPQMSDEIPF